MSSPTGSPSSVLFRCVLFLSAILTTAFSGCTPFSGLQTYRISISSECLEVTDAFFHIPTSTASQGGAIYVLDTSMTGSILRTTFFECKASDSGGSCYLDMLMSKTTYCCFRSSFSSVDGQALRLTFAWQNDPDTVACDVLTFLLCGQDGALTGGRGTVTAEQPDWGTSRSLQYCNFSFCTVTGLGAAVDFPNADGGIPLNYGLVEKCSGTSLVYSKQMNDAKLSSCWFYGNTIPEDSACIRLDAVFSCTACVFGDSAKVYDNTLDGISEVRFTQCWFYGPAPTNYLTSCHTGQTTQSYSWTGCVTYLCPYEEKEKAPPTLSLPPPFSPARSPLPLQTVLPTKSPFPGTGTFTAALKMRRGEIWRLGIGWLVFVDLDFRR